MIYSSLYSLYLSCISKKTIFFFWKYSCTGCFLLCICFSQGTCGVGPRTVHKCFSVSGWAPPTQSWLELFRHSGRLLRGCYIFSWGFLFPRDLVPRACCGGFQGGLTPTPCILVVTFLLARSRIYVLCKMCHTHMVRLDLLLRYNLWDLPLTGHKPKGKRRVRLGQWGQSTDDCCAVIKGTEKQNNEFGMDCVQKCGSGA